MSRVFLHPSSVNFSQRDYYSQWIVYYEKVKTSKVFLRDSTMIPPYALLLMAGNIEIQHARDKLLVDGWMYFSAPTRVGVLIRELRREMDALLSAKINDPHLDISGSPVVSVICRLLIQNGS